MNKKTVGLLLLGALVLVGCYFIFGHKPINGTSQPETIAYSGYWYQGEVIHIEEFSGYDIIYILGRVYMYTDIHVTIIRQMPSTFIIKLDEGDHLKLGEILYRIEKTNVAEGWVKYEIS